MSITKQTKIKLGRATFDVRPKSDRIVLSIGTKATVISKKEMWAVLFAVMGPEQMEAMMPVRKEFINRYRKKLSVRLARDMKAGECVNIICEVDVEKTIADAIEAQIVSDRTEANAADKEKAPLLLESKAN